MYHATTLTLTAGQTFSLTAAATGSPLPDPQWYVDDGGGYDPISNATGNTLSFTSDISQNGYLYKCIYSNGVGTPAETNPCTLTVNAATGGVSTIFSIDFSQGITTPQTGLGTYTPVPVAENSEIHTPTWRDVSATPAGTTNIAAGSDSPPSSKCLEINYNDDQNLQKYHFSGLMSSGDIVDEIYVKIIMQYHPLWLPSRNHKVMRLTREVFYAGDPLYSNNEFLSGDTILSNPYWMIQPEACATFFGSNDRYVGGMVGGTWNTIEFYCKMNTTTSPYNGIFKMWENGVNTITITDMAWLPSGCDAVATQPWDHIWIPDNMADYTLSGGNCTYYVAYIEIKDGNPYA